GELGRAVRIGVGDRPRDVGQTVERARHRLELLANLAAGAGPLVTRPALRGVREHELVARLDGLDTPFELVPCSVHRAHGSTFQRSGSCDFAYSSRVIQPRIIERVNISFSGRSAK